MAKLIITRKKEFSNRAAGYKVYLNKQEIETIASGETKEIDIPEGTHNLYVKINWYGSRNLPMILGNGETKIVSISGNKYSSINMIILSLMILSTILFREFIRNHIFLKYSAILIIVIALVIVTYYLTIGRNKYIEIKENPEQTE